jgi:4-oxalocrotonate tautomerase
LISLFIDFIQKLTNEKISMPLITLKISGQKDLVLAEQLAKTITDLTKDVLNKPAAVIVVIVSFLPNHLWFVNSVSLAELKTKSFQLNLKIEKSKYIDAVHLALSRLLGGIHPVSYTAIEEMKADAYGYDGKTVEYKYITNQKK